MKRRAWEGGELTLYHLFLVKKFALTLGAQALGTDGPTFACIAKVPAGLWKRAAGRTEDFGTEDKLSKTSLQRP